MLRVTARFFAGVLRPVASAQWLLDEFFDRLRRRHGLAHSAEPPWDWLAAHAGVQRGLLDELRELVRPHSGRSPCQSGAAAADYFADFRTNLMTNALQDLESALQQRIGEVVLGVGPAVRALCIAVVARGHVLVQGVPGLGKTLLSKSLAGALGGSFKRIQGTSDLMPTDITGTHLFDARRTPSCSGPGRCSPMWCCSMRSIAPVRGPSRRCWRRWRSVRCRLIGRCSRCRRISW